MTGSNLVTNGKPYTNSTKNKVTANNM